MAKILLIDDSQLARNLLRLILEEEGYTVCGEASNGREGLEKYKQLKPDLVFCDIMMNEVNGVECLQAILAEDPDAKVVMCTSVGDKLHFNETIEAGAKGFVTKPIKTAEVSYITRLLIGEPTPASQKSYKDLMEEKALEKGLERKAVLDFFAAFRQLNGFELDDPRVDNEYLRENAESVTIGVRALLSAKMPTAQADHLMKIFDGLQA